jgi:hypothetical protein
MSNHSLHAGLTGFALFAATLATAPLIAAPAVADPMCGNRQNIFSQLQKDFGEQPSGAGMASNGGLVELLTSDNGSWTLVMSYPNGATCLIATGENWQVKDKAQVVAEKAA